MSDIFHRSKEYLSIDTPEGKVMYLHKKTPNEPVSKATICKVDNNKLPVEDCHHAQHDVSGVWYIYNPDGSVVDTLDDQYFDEGDIAFILYKLDRSGTSLNFHESILSLTRGLKNPINRSAIKESYIWTVLTSDDEMHDFIGEDQEEIKKELVKFLKDNDLDLVSLLNVKHVRNSRSIDKEYLSDLEESLMEYELSWVERTRSGRTIFKSKGFKDMDSLDKYREKLKSNPKVIGLVATTDPDGTTYLEGKSVGNQLMDISDSGRYELYMDNTGTYKVLDTETYKYVNSELSNPEDFESWKED